MSVCRVFSFAGLGGFGLHGGAGVALLGFEVVAIQRGQAVPGAGQIRRKVCAKSATTTARQRCVPGKALCFFCAAARKVSSCVWAVCSSRSCSSAARGVRLRCVPAVFGLRGV